MIKKLFSDKEFYNKLLHLALPISFQSLMLAAVAAADSVMLGRINQNFMSAVSLATQIQFVQNMFIFAISGAGVILGAQYWGKGNRKALQNIFCIMLRYSGLISMIFCVACETIPEMLMKLFTNEPILIEIGVPYLKIAGWSYFLTGISQCYLTMMKVTDRAKLSAIISSTSVILNIILNAIFIFGLLGAPAMNANGAAFATLISRIVEVILVFLVSTGNGFVRPSIKGLFLINKLLSKDFLKALAPVTGASLLWGIGFTSYTSVMGHMGVDATAANAVAAVVRDLMCCLCNGIASAGGIIVGNELGKGELKKGKEYGIKLAVLSAVIGVACCIIIISVSPLVVSFMVLEEKAKSYLIYMMIIMAVYMIARCIATVVINGIFSSGGDTLFDVYSLIVFMWGIAVPLAFLGAFRFHWPVLLVYACTCVDEIGKIPWVIHHFRKYKWVKDLTRDELK